MTRPISSILAVACSCLVFGCNDAQPPIPAPRVETPPAEPAARTPVPPLPLPPAVAPNAADTARDSPATRPMGNLDGKEESKSMPMAGQANNHSSPALEKPATEKPAAQ